VTTLLRRRSESAGLDMPRPDELVHAMARLVPDPVQLALGLFAMSPVMADNLDLARRVAKVDSTLLSTDETGSGKEQVARFIHEKSPRAAGPFVAFNYGAINEALFESELFGHARGAFSGAIQDRPGLFEAANHGTILLDEIGEISLSLRPPEVRREMRFRR
ncbi:MAG: sigma-54 factor interaction domain-containing protein, partial [Holophaga sp.]|nr:sigma-54 factor interaction domain-containing protein [Holophaga sp.]